MKKGMVVVSLLAMFFATYSITFAGPPEKDRRQWVKADVVAMETQSSMAVKTSYDPGEEITVPEVWFGGWGHDDKYQLSFYAEGVDPKYQILFGMNEWTYASLIAPQSEQVLANEAGFEAVPFPYVQAGVFVSGPGTYDMEVRIYVGDEWYFLFKETMEVPAFEAWLSDVCTDDGQVNLTFMAYPLFFLSFEEGDVITVQIGEDFFTEATVSIINEWGEAKFQIIVDTIFYEGIKDSSVSSIFQLADGEIYSRDIYYWEGDECSQEEPPSKGESERVSSSVIAR